MAWQNAGGGQAGNMAEQNGVQAYTLQGIDGAPAPFHLPF